LARADDTREKAIATGRGRWSEARDPVEWDQFVTRNGGSVFQTWSWRRLLEDRGLSPFYMVSRGSDGAIVAACPFVYSRGRRFLYLDILPDSFMGDPIVSENVGDAREVFASLAGSVRFSPRRPVLAIHIIAHKNTIIEPLKALGFANKEVKYGLLITDLGNSSLDQIWSQGLEKHDRQAIKYYESRGTLFRVTSDRNDYEEFFELSEGPDWNPHGKENLYSNANIQGSLRLAQVVLEGKTIAGLLFLVDPPISTVHLLTVRYSVIRNIHSPVTYVNWKMIGWANENGFRYIDFGPWLSDHVVDSAHLAHRMKNRFQATFVPRVKFTIQPSGISYAIARKINRGTRRFSRALGASSPDTDS